MKETVQPAQEQLVPRAETGKPAGSFFLNGLRLSIRTWPCLVWAYLVNLGFALLVGISLSRGFANALQYSVASHGILGNFNISSVGALLHARRLHGIEPQELGLFGLSLVEFALLLFLIAGTVYVYLTGERAKTSILLVRGGRYFWRFVEISVVGSLVVVPLFVGLLALRSVLLRHAIDSAPNRAAMFGIVSAVVVLIAASPLRLWLDLAEIYVVRNGILENRRVLASFAAALRFLARNWVRMFSGFLLVGALGAGLLTGCLYLWKDLVRADQIWGACVVSQLVLFLLLAMRFWQRGMEVALILSAEPATTPAAVLIEDPVPAEAHALIESGEQNPPPALEPTIQELVQKLRSQPWGKPDAKAVALEAIFASAASAPLSASGGSPAPASAQAPVPASTAPAAAPSSVSATAPASAGPQVDPVRPAQDSLIAEHGKKMRLLDPFAEGADADNSAGHPSPPRNRDTGAK
jgi:hypothetical protein